MLIQRLIWEKIVWNYFASHSLFTNITGYPSFNETLWAVKAYLFLVVLLPKVKNFKLPSGFVAWPELLATSRKKGIFSIAQLYCEGSVFGHYHHRPPHKGTIFKCFSSGSDLLVIQWNWSCNILMSTSEQLQKWDQDKKKAQKSNIAQSTQYYLTQGSCPVWDRLYIKE